jgi:hypothetical protein
VPEPVSVVDRFLPRVFSAESAGSADSAGSGTEAPPEAWRVTPAGMEEWKGEGGWMGWMMDGQAVVADGGQLIPRPQFSEGSSGAIASK